MVKKIENKHICPVWNLRKSIITIVLTTCKESRLSVYM